MVSKKRYSLGNSQTCGKGLVSLVASLTDNMPVQFAPAAVEAALYSRFVVGPQIAVGGQGAVFRATRILRPDGTQASDVVALKLHLYHTQDIRAQREVAAMETISHPALARMVENGTCEVAGRRTRYVAWEFIDGQTWSPGPS